MRRTFIGIILLSTLSASASLACGLAADGTIVSAVPPLAATLDRALVEARLPASEMET